MPRDCYQFMQDPEDTGLEELAQQWLFEEAETQAVIARVIEDDDRHDEKEGRHG